MEKKSDNKHIVISGASRGLGAEFVKALLKDGWNVSGFSRKKTKFVEQTEKDWPDSFFFSEVDISDSTALSEFVAEARTHFGMIYGLLNNAATAQQGILATLPEVEISKMIAINLDAAIRLTRHCVRDMMRINGGRIINISSIVGTRGYNGLSVYSATKAGLDGFSRSLAREVGRKNVTVNSVAPGYMKTDMSLSLSSGQLSQIERRTPMGRMAELGDIVPIVKYLLSDEAAFVTAQTILVDGGISN